MSVMIASQIPAKLVAAAMPSDRQNEGELMKRILLLGSIPRLWIFLTLHCRQV
jgi:hypothetical protein